MWSFTLNCSVMLAYVHSEFIAPGTKLSVDIFRKRRAATVRREPLYDPDNLRPRS